MKKTRIVRTMLTLNLGLAVLFAQPGMSFPAEAEAITEDSENIHVNPQEEGDQANSFRYEDGEPIETPANALRSATAAAWSRTISSSGAVTCYNGNGAKIANATMKGIDVSKYQGTIDWAKVKASDVDFAIIRVGYGQNYTSQDDPYWLTNAKACEKQGIPYGAYIYSYAKTTAAAESEADHVLRLVNGRSMSLPIYFDMEDSSTVGSDYAAIAKAFCTKIEAAGYKAAIYANKDWFTNKLTNSFFNTKDRWVAQYNDTACTYTGSFNVWQSTSSGKVSGVSGNVDLDFAIGTNVLAPVTGVSLNKTSASVDKGSAYQLSASVKPLNATNKGVSWSTSDSSVATVSSAGKVTAVAAGTATITAKAKDGSGKTAACTITVSGTSSSSVTVTAPKATTSFAYTAKTTSQITLSWKKVSGASGYTIYRYYPTKKKYGAIYTAKSTATSYTVSRLGGSTGAALKAGTSYQFRIAPYVTISGKNYYGPAKGVTATTKCKAPTVSKVSRSSSTKAKVAWKKVSGAAGYVVYYSTKKSSGYKAAKTVSNKTASYTKTGLKKGKTYYFKVCAYRKVGGKTVYSNYSNVKSVKL